MSGNHVESTIKRNRQQKGLPRSTVYSKALFGAATALAVILTVNLSVSLESAPSQRLQAFYYSSGKQVQGQQQVAETMSCCMLIMDDNHWLVEWLAYHYTVVNLRHVIIAVDPRSKTSLMPIVNRWKDRIHFEFWNDSHYHFHPQESEMDLQEVNLARQQSFLAKCMLTYKQRNHSWVMFTDTDEFITINPRTRRRKHALYRPFAPPLHNRQEAGSILSFLQKEHDTRGTSCFSMGRLQFSPDESSLQEINRGIPDYLNASHFLTLRWRHPADDLVGPKNIVHLNSIPTFLIPTNYTHQHRVVWEKCPEAGFAWNRHNSLLQIYHYLGTLQQFEFRNDARLSLEWAGRNERFERYSGEGVGTRDDLRPWIRAFARSVGKDEAIRLLEGVGRTEGWPSANATIFADRPCCVSTKSGASREDVGADERVFYSIAKTDRSGAAVADMLLAHAYGFANNIRYAGACANADLPYREKTEQLIEAVGLQDILSYACPEKGGDEMILDRQVYISKNTRIFTAAYLKNLHTRVKYPPSARNHTVVVHVRRGDVSPCGFYANRYLPNSHYLQILKEYVPPELPVTILSELESFETFDDFRNYSLELDTDLAEAWKAMITADYIVLSKSSFSMIPAILNSEATVIYTPFMQKKLPQWTTVNEEIMEHTQEELLELIEQRCSPEEKKIALQKLS